MVGRSWKVHMNFRHTIFAKGGTKPFRTGGGGQSANVGNDDAHCPDGVNAAFGPCNLATLELRVVETHS